MEIFLRKLVWKDRESAQKWKIELLPISSKEPGGKLIAEMTLEASGFFSFLQNLEIFQFA